MDGPLTFGLLVGLFTLVLYLSQRRGAPVAPVAPQPSPSFASPFLSATGGSAAVPAPPPSPFPAAAPSSEADGAVVAAPASPEAGAAPPAAAKLSILSFALIIIPLNLVWAYAQELVGATAYGTCASPSDGNCERFRSIPVMNLLQALLASAVAWVCAVYKGASISRVGPMTDLLPVCFDANRTRAPYSPYSPPKKQTLTPILNPNQPGGALPHGGVTRGL